MWEIIERFEAEEDRDGDSIGINALKSALKLLASYILQNKIDDYVDVFEGSPDGSDQVAIQFNQALNEAYRKTCEEYDWQYSPNAIKDYFLTNKESEEEIPVNNNFAAILKYILGEGVDFEGLTLRLVTEDVVKYWKDAFEKAVSTRQTLANYFFLRRSEEKLKDFGNDIKDRVIGMRDGIRLGVIAPCNTYVEGGQRQKDLEELERVFSEIGQAIWLYGEGGIGKTQIMLRFAQKHPEYKYVFVKYTSSIEQTVSQNLFFLKGLENRGRELEDIVRFERNMEVFGSYGQDMVLLIDGYDPDNYEELFREATEGYLDADNIHIVESDQSCINRLLSQKIHVIISTRTNPGSSDSYHIMEIQRMDEDELLQVMLNGFPAIQLSLDEEKELMLREMIKAAEHNTVIIAIMAAAMQVCGRDPETALKELHHSINSPRIESFPQKKYYIGYTGNFADMAQHMEKIFRFLGLNWSQKEVLRMVAMLPPEGVDYELYKRITESGAVHYDGLREDMIKRFGKYNLLTMVKDDDGQIKRIRVHAMTARYALWVLQQTSPKPLSEDLSLTWTRKLLDYFNDEKLGRLTPSDEAYKNIEKVARLCMVTESRLERGESGFQTRYQLLVKAAELYLKVGNVKNALECTERAIAVDGASSNDMKFFRTSLVRFGSILYHVGRFKDSLEKDQQAMKLMEDEYGLDEEIDVEEVIELIADDIECDQYAILCNYVGTTYGELGEHRRALEYKEKALEISKKVLPENHPGILSIQRIIELIRDRKPVKNDSVSDDEQGGNRTASHDTVNNNIAAATYSYEWYGNLNIEYNTYNETKK